jgi:AcrR family transcriptional regulator
VPGPKVPEEQRREAILRAAYAVAARDGLAAVTGRAVAGEAGVSSGLVFFHFRTKDALLAALLEWLLAHTLVAGEMPHAPPASASAAERMLAVVRRDLEALPRARARVELFFHYWVLGTRDETIRQTIRAALDRYRASFLPLAEAVIAESPGGRHAPGAAAGLAAVAASFVEGNALRAVLDPAGFDVAQAMTTLEALLRVPPAAAAPSGAAASAPRRIRRRA